MIFDDPGGGEVKKRTSKGKFFNQSDTLYPNFFKKTYTIKSYGIYEYNIYPCK